MNVAKMLVHVAVAVLLSTVTAFAGEIVEQPCAGDCPEAMWSAPLYASVFMSGDSDPVKIKYRHRLNRCAVGGRFEVFVDWIASTGTDSEATLDQLWSSPNDPATMIEEVGIELLLANPMLFPPLVHLVAAGCEDYAIVAGSCFSRMESIDCPDQYVSTCETDFCVNIVGEICILNLGDIRERYAANFAPVGSTVLFTPISNTDVCPVITNNTVSTIATCIGSTATLSVSPEPSVSSLFYQWQIMTPSGWEDVADADQSTYQLANIGGNLNQSEYRVLVRNYCGVTASEKYVFVVDQFPTIAVQPASFTANVAGTARFKVVVSNPYPPDFQWQVNTGSGWSDISGATESLLELPAVGISMDGNQYRVVITTGCGSDVSGIATLTVTI